MLVYRKSFGAHKIILSHNHCIFKYYTPWFQKAREPQLMQKMFILFPYKLTIWSLPLYCNHYATADRLPEWDNEA